MSKLLAQIRESLSHVTLEWKPRVWLDTGIPDLNRVIGHKLRGIPYGRIIEMSGLESHGKTALVMALAALAQRDGALVIWADLENSFDYDWAIQRGIAKCPACLGKGRDKDGKHCKNCGEKHPCDLCDGGGCKECANSGEVRGTGLDPAKLVLVQPYVGRFMVKASKPGAKPKLGEPRLSTGTELLAEAEKCILASREKFDRMFIVVDSIAAILTEGEAAAGIEGRNMRTNADLPMFLSSLLRRWVGFAQAYNCSVMLTNQLRLKPGVKFGSPWYTTGGNAPHFYSHVRVHVGRVKGGKIVDKGKTIGIQGVMKALKNKSGGLEGSEVGYKIMFDGKVLFVPAKQMRKEISGGEDE